MNLEAGRKKMKIEGDSVKEDERQDDGNKSYTSLIEVQYRCCFPEKHVR
jgi:hypothetical protein